MVPTRATHHSYWLKSLQKTIINVVFFLMNLFMTISTFFFFHSFYLFKYQPNKMVKHTQTIRRLLPRDCLNVFDHFVGLGFKGLNIIVFVYNGLNKVLFYLEKINSFCCLETVHSKRLHLFLNVKSSWCQHAWWKFVFLIFVPHGNWKRKLQSRIAI